MGQAPISWWASTSESDRGQVRRHHCSSKPSLLRKGVDISPFGHTHTLLDVCVKLPSIWKTYGNLKCRVRLGLAKIYMGPGRLTDARTCGARLCGLASEAVRVWRDLRGWIKVEDQAEPTGAAQWDTLWWSTAISTQGLTPGTSHTALGKSLCSSGLIFPLCKPGMPARYSFYGCKQQNTGLREEGQW